MVQHVGERLPLSRCRVNSPLFLGVRVAQHGEGEDQLLAVRAPGGALHHLASPRSQLRERGTQRSEPSGEGEDQREAGYAPGGALFHLASQRSQLRERSIQRSEPSDDGEALSTSSPRLPPSSASSKWRRAFLLLSLVLLFLVFLACLRISNY